MERFEALGRGTHDRTAASRIKRLMDQLGVRISAVAVLSIVAIIVARLGERLLPSTAEDIISPGQVEELLKIIANSMLAISIFSLSTMVTVFRSASSQWTPRVHRLMLEDRTTQNTLATFIGAYVYALVSLIMMYTGVIREGDVVVLFLFTIVILILIIAAIINWVTHLRTFGSLIEVTRRIEAQTVNALSDRTSVPCLGGNRLEHDDDVPTGAVPLPAHETGYIQHVFMTSFSDLAVERDVDIYLTAPVGTFVHRGQTIAFSSTAVTDAGELLRDCVVIGDVRTFEQDPRFGLIVLGEIGSKALSAGINDPGTAIDVLERLGRVIEQHAAGIDRPSEDPQHPRLWVSPLRVGDMVEDGFHSIARDGSAMIEVQVILQKVLRRLSDHPDDEIRTAAMGAAEDARQRAESAMQHPGDLRRLREYAPAGGTERSS